MTNKAAEADRAKAAEEKKRKRKGRGGVGKKQCVKAAAVVPFRGQPVIKPPFQSESCYGPIPGPHFTTQQKVASGETGRRKYLLGSISLARHAQLRRWVTPWSSREVAMIRGSVPVWNLLLHSKQPDELTLALFKDKESRRLVGNWVCVMVPILGVPGAR